MSAPRTKRPFAGAAADPSQRHITSFFGPRPSPDDADFTAAAAAAPELARQPVLPSGVQSNLLSVGMRIRKSVPEGYKTASAASAFKLWTDNAPARTAAASATARVAAGEGARAQRELMPFCGINSIGGLDAQPAAPDHGGVPDLEDVPELALSQESVESAPGSSEPSRKRILDEDDGADDQRPVLAWDGQVSPRSLAPMGWRNGRVMAVPRSRVKKSAAALADVGQENMAVDGDFEDAEFLVYEEEGSQMDMTG